MKAFKVVRVKDDRYFSAYVGRDPMTPVEELFETEYFIGEFVKPRVSALYAFKTLTDARNFCGCTLVSRITYKIF